MARAPAAPTSSRRSTRRSRSRAVGRHGDRLAEGVDRRGDADRRQPNEADRPGLRLRRLQLVLLGEGMCTAAINVGPELHAGAALRRGEVALRLGDRRGDDGVRPDDRELRDARTGPTQLDLGNAAAAGTDAATIRREFVANMSTDGSTSAARTSRSSRSTEHLATVDPSFRGLTINGAPDPRVAVTNGQERNRPGTPIWTPDKYPALPPPCRSRGTPKRS